MHSPVCKRVISDADTTSCFKLRHQGLIWVVVQVVNDKVAEDTASGSICHFLQSYACYCFVVHVIGGDADAVFCDVDFVPQKVPKFVIIFVNTNFSQRSVHRQREASIIL